MFLLANASLLLVSCFFPHNMLVSAKGWQLLGWDEQPLSSSPESSSSHILAHNFYSRHNELACNEKSG
jgi:hypothetical protein